MKRGLALLWTLAAAVALGLPGQSLPEAPVLAFDKVVHLVLFAVFGILWLRAYPRSGWVVLTAGLVFGLSAEIYQHLMPINRTFSLADFAADGLGLALGLGFGTWFRTRAGSSE